MGCEVVGLGTYLPKSIISNDFFVAKENYAPDLQEFFDGVITRRHASREETSVFMGEMACANALASAGMKASEIDLLITYSLPHDNEVPKDGSFIAKNLDMKNAICMSIDTVCSSFLTALKTACAFIEAGYHNNVMICVNSNWVTRCMDVTKDYSSLGDGSGALILRRSSKRSLLGVKEECRTEFSSVICMNSPIVTKRNEYFQFGKTGDSKEFFVSTAANVAKELMVNCGVFPNSIDWFICHQSGIRLMNSWRQQLEIDAQKHIHCFEELGNMSASNAIINFALGVASGKIKRGDKVLFFSPAAGVHNIALLWQY